MIGTPSFRRSRRTRRAWRRNGSLVLALAILLAYSWTVWQARRGAADPVWQRIQATGVLRVGTDPGFAPFALEQRGAWDGYDVALAREVAQRLGLRAEFVAMSYDSLYPKLEAGDVDLLASALPLAPEQGWRARFSAAYLDAGLVLVTRADSAITDETLLAGQRVGAALGSDGDTALRRLQRTTPAINANSAYALPTNALAALQQGALDAVLTDAISALEVTQRDPHFHIARSLSFEPYVLAMPITAYQLQSQVNRVLDDLHREGFIAQLNARWFGDPQIGD